MQRLQAFRGRVQGLAPLRKQAEEVAPAAAALQPAALRRPTDPLRQLRDR